MSHSARMTIPPLPPGVHRPRLALLAECDRCETPAGVEVVDPAGVDVDAVRAVIDQEASAAGWRVTDGRHYCPDCASAPAPLTFDDAWLCCPTCGGDYVHIPSVTVGASGRGGSVTVTAGGEGDWGQMSVAMSGGPVANPGSGRRWAITLHLGCENCADGTDVTFAQHKGQTQAQIGLRAPVGADEQTSILRIPLTLTE